MTIKHDDEVNRNIDTETAEGHRRPPVMLEESDETGKKAAVRPAEGLDDEAEGHRLPRW